jgi:hypothetical protein
MDWPDTDDHPAYQAALRLRRALWPNSNPTAR